MTTYKEALAAAAQALLDTDDTSNPGREVTSITLSRDVDGQICVRAIVRKGAARYLDRYNYDPTATIRKLAWVSLEEVDA